MWDALDDTLDEARGHDQAGGDAGQHCMVKSRYVPSSSPHARQRIQEQVYYLQCRDRQDAEDEQRDLFTAAEIGTSRGEAREMLWANRSVKSVCFHRLILSPSTGLGMTTTEEARTWTRTVMEELGQRLDRNLTWVAAVHHNTGRPHVHVLIAGEAGQPSKAGRVSGHNGGARRVVRLGAGDMKALRERITIDAARPIREATRARQFDEARARQAARMADLDRRLGVPVGTAGQTEPATVVALDHSTPAPSSQAAPKRHWWQRGH